MNRTKSQLNVRIYLLWKNPQILGRMNIQYTQLCTELHGRVVQYTAVHCSVVKSHPQHTHLCTELHGRTVHCSAL